MLALVAALFRATGFAAPPDDVKALVNAAAPLVPVSKPAFVLDDASLAATLGMSNLSRERWAEASAKHEAITVVEAQPAKFIDAAHARATIVVHRSDGTSWSDMTTYADMARSGSGQWTPQYVATEPTAWWKAKLPDAVMIKGDVKAPVVVPSSRVEPAYPEFARRSHMGGIVILQIAIDKSGRSQAIEVLKGLPLGLTQPAADAVRQWEFKPGTRNGEPIDTLFNLTVAFKLQEDRSELLGDAATREIAKLAGIPSARIVREDEERLLAAKAVDDTMIRCDASTPVVCTVSMAKDGEWTKHRLMANDDRTRALAAQTEWWVPRAKTTETWSVASSEWAPVALSTVDAKWPADLLPIEPMPIVATLTIDKSGQLIAVRLLKPLPPGAAESAIAALRQWKFAPGGVREPSDVAYTITTRFRLDSPADGHQR